MDTLTLPIEPRETGKKAAKATRNAGRVPCVLYGPHTEPVHFSTEILALRPLIHTTQSYLIALSVDGEDHEAIVKDIAFHPVTDRPIHVDFQALTRGEMFTITVPIHVEGASVGVLAGGQLAQPLHEIEVRCLPKDIPGSISVDISSLEVGDSLHVSDLTVGDAVEVLTDADRTVVAVVAPKLTTEDDEADAAAELAEELAAEGEEGEEGEAGEAGEDSDEAADEA